MLRRTHRLCESHDVQQVRPNNLTGNLQFFQARPRPARLVLRMESSPLHTGREASRRLQTSSEVGRKILKAWTIVRDGREVIFAQTLCRLCRCYSTGSPGRSVFTSKCRRQFENEAVEASKT